MNFDSYKHTAPYPSRSDFTVTYWYRGGKCVCTQKPGESLASGFDTTGCMKQAEVDEAGLRAAREKYNAETARVTAEFKADLFKDLGIENHPMREKLYSKAWEDGHSAGFSEVYNCASNLVDLIEVPTGYVLVSADTITFGPGTRNDKATKAAERLAKEL